MFVLHNLELLLLYLVVFITGYFIYERFVAWKKIAKINIPVQARDFLKGSYLGLITLFIFLINRLIWNEFDLPLFVLTAMITSFFKNYKSALYSLIPMLIYWGLEQGGSNISIAIVISMFVMLLFIEVIKWLDQTKLYMITMASAIVAFTNFLVLAFGFDIEYKEVFELGVIVFLVSSLCLFVMRWLIKFSISSKMLYESTNFKFEGFYRSGLAEKAFEEFIRTKKIHRAFFGLVKVNFNKKSDDSKNDEIIRSYIEGLRRSFGDQHLYFAVSKDVYGFVIPYQGKIDIKQSIKGNTKQLRDIDDMLFEMQATIRNVPNMIKTSWDETVTIAPKIGVVIYGLENCSFTKLIKDASFALTSYSTKNLVSLFDAREFANAKVANRLISQMDKNITLDDYAINFIPLYDAKKKTNAFTYASVVNISEYDYYETINEIIYAKGWEKTFNRYFAAEALKKAEGKKVGFDYSLTIFEDNFNVDHFISFIEDTGNKLENIYLVIPAESINKVRDIKLVRTEIAKIKGVNFVIDNNADKEKALKIFDKVELVYKQIGDTSNNFEGANIMSFDVETEEEIKQTKQKGITIFGGNTTESKITFTKLDKQSKIYLESILKGIN